jgi:hypothetical protein
MLISSSLANLFAGSTASTSPKIALAFWYDPFSRKSDPSLFSSSFASRKFSSNWKTSVRILYAFSSFWAWQYAADNLTRELFAL